MNSIKTRTKKLKMISLDILRTTLTNFIREHGPKAEKSGLKLKQSKIVKVLSLKRFNPLVNLFFRRELRTIEKVLEYEGKIMGRSDGPRSFFIEGKV
jgi:hypothetical protein